MKKLLLLALIWSVSAFATPSDCIQKLTRDYFHDSISYTLDIDELDGQYQKDYGKDHLAQGILMIRALLSEVGCARHDINFSKGPNPAGKSLCKNIVPNIDNSLACYIESNIGFFNVSWDSLSAVHIVYNRWD